MKKVVSATLAGALAVGMVPAMALADDAELELLVTATEAFEGGTIVLGTNIHAGVDFAWDATLGAWKVSAATTAQYVVPASVTLNDGSTSVALNATDYKVTYVKAGADGKPSATAVAAPKEVGTYFVVVAAVNGDYKGAEVTGKFVIEGQDITGFSAYTMDENGDADSTTIVYTGEPQELCFYNGTTQLVEGKDYTVAWYKDGENYLTSKGSAVAPTDAGVGYYARLTGLGIYAGKTDNVVFNVDVFDAYSASSIEVDDVFGTAAALPTAPAAIDGSAALAKHFKLTYTGANFENGPITAELALVDVNDKNAEISSATSVTFYKYAAKASFSYDDAAWKDTLSVNVANAKTYFEEDDIEVFDTAGKALEAGVDYTVTYTDLETLALVSESDVNSTPGKYAVTVKVTPVAPYALGGSATVVVNTIADTVNADTNLYVYYNGKVVTDGIEVVYDPAVAVEDGITAKLFDNQETKVEISNTEYDLVFYDADGKKINTASDDITDAGTYTLKIESDSYEVANNTVEIVVKPFEVEALRINGLGTVNGKPALSYTGSALTPDFQWASDANANGKIDDTEWAAVAAPYKAVYTQNGEEVTEVKEIGTYEVAIALVDANEAANYILPAAIQFDVASPLDFVDVPTTHWAYNVIKTAKTNGYINGYGDGKLFGPDDSIKRADFVCVLYNMAGCPKIDGTNWTDGMEFDLSFADVNKRAYYAPALAWAEDAGIVNGYPDGSFKPSNSISRQEALCMLANYADAMGDFAAPADADALLAKYADGAKTASWAKDCVAWAVSEKIAGNGKALNPTGKITRAEVAAIAVNYQPAKLV